MSEEKKDSILELREQALKNAAAGLQSAKTTWGRHYARAQLKRAKRALEARRQWEAANAT